MPVLPILEGVAAVPGFLKRKRLVVIGVVLCGIWLISVLFVPVIDGFLTDYKLYRWMQKEGMEIESVADIIDVEGMLKDISIVGDPFLVDPRDYIKDKELVAQMVGINQEPHDVYLIWAYQRAWYKKKAEDYFAISLFFIFLVAVLWEGIESDKLSGNRKVYYTPVVPTNPKEK